MISVKKSPRSNGHSSSDSNDSSSSEPPKKPCLDVSIKRRISTSDEDSESPSPTPTKIKKCIADDEEESPDWRSSGNTVKERLNLLLEEKHLWDAKFIVGPPPKSEQIFAHKLILSMSSATLQTIFSEGWFADGDTIKIPDVDPTAFKTFLRFLYTDEFSCTPDTVMGVLYAAKKFEVPSLEKLCHQFIQDNASPDNAFLLLTQAKSFDAEKLVDSCLEKIDCTASEAVQADDFLNIDCETLCQVLERNSLSVCEIKLFEAVLRWAEAECERRKLPQIAENKRLVAEKALSLIRFPLMSGEEFASKVVPSGLLPDKDVIALFLYFNKAEKPPIYFDTTPRALKELVVVNRFEKVTPGWKFYGAKDEIMFNVDCDIFLAGFGLYGSDCGPGEHKVTFGLEDAETDMPLHEQSSVYKSDGSKNTARVFFEYPMKLTANKEYLASTIVKGPSAFSGTEGQQAVTHSLSDGRNITVNFKATAISQSTRVKTGQIPELLFYL